MINTDRLNHSLAVARKMVEIGKKYNLNDNELKDLHDYVSCKCGVCSIDGGKQYTRIGGDPNYINIVYENRTEKLLANNNSQIKNNDRIKIAK